MREHEELSAVASRLELDKADVEHLAGELGLKIVEHRGGRYLRLPDVCKIIRHIDRPTGGLRWTTYPVAWTRGAARGVR